MTSEVRMWSCECRIYVFEPQRKFQRQISNVEMISNHWRVLFSAMPL
jgi:hypothetical protein